MQYPYYYNSHYNDELKIVNGRNSAEHYITTPNSRVLLMDSNEDKFYIKETDAAGISNIKTYKFELIEDKEPIANYVTMEQLEEVLKKYEFTPKQQTISTATSQF